MKFLKNIPLPAAHTRTLKLCQYPPGVCPLRSPVPACEPCVYCLCVACLQGRLNELMSQLRMQNQLGQGRPDVGYQMNTSAQQEIREVRTGGAYWFNRALSSL